MKRLLMSVFAGLSAVIASASGLPAGYQQIPYIQPTGNSYVLTDYTPNPSTDKIVAEVSFPEEPTQNMCIWCARNNSTGQSSPSFTVFLLLGTGGYNFRVDYGTKFVSQNTANIAAAPTPVYTLTFDRNVFSWSGEDGTTYEFPADSSFTDASFSSSCGKMMLFASYNGNLTANGNYGKHRLHSLKVYRNGALLYDIVPVRDNNKALKLCNKTDTTINFTYGGTFTGDPWKSFLERLTASENVIPASEAEAATGGDVIWKVGDDYMHVFTNANEAASFTPRQNLTARILMVAGGGSGGGSRGGGGGAGGMIDTNGVALVANTPYVVTVGQGGVAADGNVMGNDGTASTMSALGVEAVGGGGGGTFGSAGKEGGSGGGGAGLKDGTWASPKAGGSGTLGQGSSGGRGGLVNAEYPCGGGGGGAGAVGGEATSNTKPGAGGAGRVSTILGYEEIFAGGGGGGTFDTSSAAGGVGGGGMGGDFRNGRTANDITAKPGENGCGGGGGGGPSGYRNNANAKPYGAAGGSGIVIIRYRCSEGPVKRLVAIPVAVEGLIYDGTLKTGVIADSDDYTLEENTAVEAGSYEAVATLKDAETTEWADGTFGPKYISWRIEELPENRVARWSNDGISWTGADSLSAAVTAVDDGGIVELNRDVTSSTTITVNKSVTIRSCSARDVRYTLQLTANKTLLDFKGAGASSVLSNLVANVRNGVELNFAMISLTEGALTLGHNLLLQKGSYVMGSLFSSEADVGPLTLDGVTVSDSTVKWGLFRVGNGVSVNLRDCNIYGISKSTSTEALGSVLIMSGNRSVLNVYGGSITNNAVYQANYGQVYCAGTVNFFGGKPVIEDLGVANTSVINLKGDLDADASVGVIYGAAEDDQFGTYVSGDRAGARAFYPTWSEDSKLRGAVRGTKLVWKHSRGFILVVR